MNARRGMTLMELTIGLVIAGIVVTLGYAAFAGIIDRRVQAESAGRDIAHAIAVKRTITQWLDGSSPRFVQQGIITPSSTNQLAVQTRNPTPIGSYLPTVMLFVNDGSDGHPRGLTATLYSSTALSAPTMGTDSMRVVLDTTVRGISFAFYTIGPTGVAEWETMAQMSGQAPLPRAIEVQLQSDDPVVADEFARPIIVPTQVGLR